MQLDSVVAQLFILLGLQLYSDIGKFKLDCLLNLVSLIVDGPFQVGLDYVEFHLFLHALLVQSGGVLLPQITHVLQQESLGVLYEILNGIAQL